MKLLFLLFSVSMASVIIDHSSDEFLKLLQSKATTWKAGRNFGKDMPREYLKRLTCATEGGNEHEIPLKITKIPEGFEIPTTFDSRDAWPGCPTIAEVRDQGSCGSCWAMSAVTVMSDRGCIHSDGNDGFRYSVENVAACCTSCGDGCFGGTAAEALSYWVSTGAVSGGRYNSTEGCQPYTVAECEHHTEGPRPPCSSESIYLECKHECQQGYEVDYNDDLHYGDYVYKINADVAEIQYEIMTNGPVSARFEAYDDFLYYKSGVYQHVEGVLASGHAIRIIGWGEEDGTPYWLVANSWNYDWGLQGYVRFLRGSDECGIEASVYGAMPRVA